MAGGRNRSEAQIEHEVCRWAIEHDWLAIKYTPKGDRGWPDRIFINPCGRHIWVEFKAPGKKPRKLQDYRIRVLHDHNVLAVTFDNAEDAINYLSTFTS